MLTFTAEAAAHLNLDATTLTTCWAVYRNDGVVLRGTQHNKDLPIASGPYAGTYTARSAAFATDVQQKSDGSVSNLDVDGAFRLDAEIGEITVAQIEGGLFDQSRAVLLLVNWVDRYVVKVMCAGTLGEFSRDSNGAFRSEVRGLTQALQQNIVQTYSERCNVKLFGDARCKFDVAAVTRTGTVATVANRRSFTVTLDAGPAPLNATYYNGGRLVFTSGPNLNAVREIKTATLVSSTLTVELWDEAPDDIAIGNTVSVPPGCDRRLETCRDVHDNIVNFRGYGCFAAGKDALLRGPT
jgi:uncharacterized phage protein (TIGR02218 family)